MGRRMAVYRPDHKSFGEFLLSQGLRDTVAKVAAEEILPLAIKNTPRSRGYTGKPHMQDQYRVVVQGGTMKVDRALRVVVKVVNDSEHSAAVEFGNRLTKRHRPLGRAGAAVGDFKPEGGLER
jgi:hypothetical protein